MRVKVITIRPIGERVKAYLKSIGETIVEDKPDILISCYNPRILKKEEYEAQPTINFHPGYLPYNKGMFPHIWPLFDGTPAGVTIHYVTGEVDGGNIIGQRKIKVKPTYTAGYFEVITQTAMFKLFVKVWPKIKAGYKGRKQVGRGTYHFAKEIGLMQEFDRYTMRRLAACTFHDRTYGYFYDENGKKIKVGIKFYEA